MTDRLYDMCRLKGIAPLRVAEVGVYLPETSNVIGFIRDGVPASLVEADPDCVARIREYFAAFPGVEVFPYAIWDDNGLVSLYRAAASTFVGELAASPALVNDSYVPSEDNRFEVETRRFSEIDGGDIDLLSIDIEGAEWYVLKHLRSRPRVITLETHSARYHNPFLREIEQWMDEHGYVPWFMDRTDSVYVRADDPVFTKTELARGRIRHRLSVLRHRLKGAKRALRKRLFGS